MGQTDIPEPPFVPEILSIKITTLGLATIRGGQMQAAAAQLLQRKKMTAQICKPVQTEAVQTKQLHANVIQIAEAVHFPEIIIAKTEASTKTTTLLFV